MAEKHMGALYAHEPKGGFSSPGMATGGGMVLDDTYRPTPGDAYVDGKKLVAPSEPAAAVAVPQLKNGGKVALKKKDSAKHEAAESAMKERHEKMTEKMPMMKKGGTETITAPGKKPITFTPGGLHASTGTPAGEKIPAGKKRAALLGKLGKKAAAQARFAKNVLTGPK
jgi:hypothetical protein